MPAVDAVKKPVLAPRHAAPTPEQQGQLEAERYDAALREDEQSRLRERLAVLAEDDDGEPVDAAALAELVRLRLQVEDLASFKHAVLRSRGWQVLQLLRGLVGRAW